MTNCDLSTFQGRNNFLTWLEALQSGVCNVMQCFYIKIKSPAENETKFSQFRSKKHQEPASLAC